MSANTTGAIGDMAYIQHLWLYFILVLGIIVVPGMDMLFVLANALVGGSRAGLAATSGIMLGGACHVLFGVTAVVALATLMPSVYMPMLVVGSLYMLWIGWTLMRSAITVDAVQAAAAKPVGGIFAQGLVTCIVNPKAWLFGIAVFPQFVRPEFGPPLPQALAMMVITVLVQGAVYGGLALASLRGRDALVSNPAVTIWLGRGAGALLAAVAALALWETLRQVA